MQVFKNLVKVLQWNVCMQMSFTISCRPGREPEWLLPPLLRNCFSKQMSKRKISCLTTSHPSSAQDRVRERLLSLCRVRGQPWVLVSWVWGTQNQNCPWARNPSHLGISGDIASGCQLLIIQKTVFTGTVGPGEERKNLVMAVCSGLEALCVLLRAAEQTEHTAPDLCSPSPLDLSKEYIHHGSCEMLGSQSASWGHPESRVIMQPEFPFSSVY